MPPSTDAEVLGDRQTEVWARVYMPADMAVGMFPVVMMLHGNHETCGIGSNPRVDNNCQYTTTGTCPAGYTMAPSYLGYGYIADRLASWGYVVVSINANLGINCGAGITFDDALVLARGRLVLKHLEVLSGWNVNGGTPASLGVELMGKLDFGNVGLLGHSRGGEGMRAAYELYRDVGSPWPARILDPVNIAGIFEIGPVDGTSYRTLNVNGTKWNVLLPMCDGDVKDLQGVKPFDRAMRMFTESPASQKSTTTIWGANHNFYNTEWQSNESSGCTDHLPLWAPGDFASTNQQQTALYTVMAFFRANVGAAADATFNRTFNPQYDVPIGLSGIARLDRGYSDSANTAITQVFEDFTAVTGTSSYGFPNDSSGLFLSHGGLPNHDAIQRAASILWTAPGGYLQTNWTGVGLGNDISTYATLDLRVSRRFDDLNGPVGSITNFSIQLAHADGTLSSPVALTSYTNLTGPVGSPTGLRHPILQTARIPLSDFTGANLASIRGVRLTFDGSATGAIWVANIRLSSINGLTAPAAAAPTIARALTASRVVPSSAAPESIPLPGSIEVRRVPASRSGSLYRTQSGISPDTSVVELVVRSVQPFTIGDALPVLNVGGQLLRVSRVGDGGDTSTLIFSATSAPTGAATLDNGQQTYSLGSL